MDTEFRALPTLRSHRHIELKFRLSQWQGIFNTFTGLIPIYFNVWVYGAFRVFGTNQVSLIVKDNTETADVYTPSP